MNKKFYITTAIDYTNEVIHIGHLYQKIIADALARYHRLLGEKVFFLTGTDEHGGKVEEAAIKAGFGGKEKDFVDQITLADKKAQESLEVSFNRFIRTTDKDHVKFCLKFWEKVEKNGDIYLGEYDGIYCEGCEGFINKSDLIDGKCPYHPNKDPKTIKEKNYFFKLSKYSQFLKDYLNEHSEFVWPEGRRKEMLSFIDQGLEDIPISRQRIKWGIPVPNDPGQTIYVWFDALINYITGDPGGFWPADIHILGKDNARFHAILWPAMLKSAGYELPKTILVNGFLSLNGQKISKSLGNIIPTEDLIKQFGADGIRFYLLKTKSIDTDGDINLDKIKETYNADLANGLGNLVARISKLCEKENLEFSFGDEPSFSPKVAEKIKTFKLNEALTQIWDNIAGENKRISEKKPWKLKDEDLKVFLTQSAQTIRQIAFDLQPFLPKTAGKILTQLSGPKIKSGSPLFPRI